MHLDDRDRCVRRLAPGVCYIHHAVVFPTNRSRGVFQTLLWHQYQSAAQRGWRYVTNLIEYHNLPSLKAHTNLGHRFQSIHVFLLPTGRVAMLGFRPTWESPAASH